MRRALLALFLAPLSISCSGADPEPAPPASPPADAGPAQEPNPFRAYARPAPGVVPAELHAGRETSCALRGDGMVACWGNGEGVHYLAVPETPFTQFAIGNNQGCGLRADGSIGCWGDAWTDDAIYLGPPATGTFKKLALGNFAACAIDATDHLRCWGSRTSATPPTTEEVVDVASGPSSICAIQKADGKILCTNSTLNKLSNAKPVVALNMYRWENAGCALDADSDAVCASASTAAETTTGPFLRVARGLDSQCAVKAGGALQCWGTQALITGAVPAGTDFVDITVGAAHACARKTDGHVACWGRDANWQTRVPEGKVQGGVFTASRLCLEKADHTLECCCDFPDHPLETGAPDLSTLTRVTTGYTHLCGLQSGGAPRCWGGYDGQSELAAPGGTTCTQIESGWESLCCLKGDGEVGCWTPMFNQALDVNPPPAGPFVEIATAWRWACARKADNSVTCWGNDTPPDASTKSYKKLFGGFKTLCGVKADDTLECIGRPNASSAGVLSPPAGKFKDVSFEADAACGIKDDGTLACWGHNANVKFTVPGGKFKSVHSGNSSCAVDEQDRLHCFWGYLRTPMDKHRPVD